MKEAMTTITIGNAMERPFKLKKGFNFSINLKKLFNLTRFLVSASLLVVAVEVAVDDNYSYRKNRQYNSHYTCNIHQLISRYYKGTMENQPFDCNRRFYRNGGEYKL